MLARSPEPEVHDNMLDNNPDLIGIWKCWFLRKGENRSTNIFIEVLVAPSEPILSWLLHSVSKFFCFTLAYFFLSCWDLGSWGRMAGIKWSSNVTRGGPGQRRRSRTVPSRPLSDWSTCSQALSSFNGANMFQFKQDLSKITNKLSWREGCLQEYLSVGTFPL